MIRPQLLSATPKKNWQSIQMRILLFWRYMGATSILVVSFSLLAACANTSNYYFFSSPEDDFPSDVRSTPDYFSELRTLGSRTLSTEPVVPESILVSNPVSNNIFAQEEQGVIEASFDQRLIDIDSAIDSYLQALKLLDREESLSIALELGELYMRKADLLIAGPDTKEVIADRGQMKAFSDRSKKVLDVAVKHYEWTLATYFPRGKQSSISKSLAEAHIFYQLSTALALQQNLNRSIAYLSLLVKEHPSSGYYVESQFRRGEYFFSLEDYASAAAAFTEAATNKQGALYEKSLYMLGWAAFKNGDFDAALGAMTSYLDAADTTNIASSNAAPSDSAQRAVILDSIRVIVFSFGYQDGVQSLSSHFRQYPGRSYEAAVYDQYIKLLLQQNRRSEAIGIANNFVETHPENELAPMFFSRSISLSQGHVDTAELMEQKVRFIGLYGIKGIYGISAPSHQTIASEMADPNAALGANSAIEKSESSFDLEKVTATYLRDLANGFYIAATKSKRLIDNKPLQTDKKTDVVSDENTTKLYIKAASYYDEYIKTFPVNADLYEMHYLLAESLFGAKLWRQAASEYQLTAYELAPHKHSAEAGYAVIKTWEKIIADHDQKNHDRLREDKTKLLEAESRYAYTFTDKPNALLVAANAMELATQLNQDDKAIRLADFVLAQLETGNPYMQNQHQLRQLVMINKTSALFHQHRFAEAESSAKKLLLLMNEKDPQRTEIEHLLAATIYKQTGTFATNATNKEKNTLAVQRLLEIVAVAPKSSVAPVALYDAAALSLASEQWTPSAKHFERFLELYPEHDLAKEIPERLVFLYEQEGQWEMAAQWLTVLSASALTETEKASQLFRAASFYEKSGNQEKAIEYYREYAHQYPNPMSMVMQARYALINIYGERGEQEKQQYWVTKVLSDNAQRPDEVDEQSLRVVRAAALQQADWRYQEYRLTRLSFPLNRTIKQKKSALTAVVGAYEAVVNVGDQTQINQAIYKIGEIYQSLAKEIITGESPDSLNELEKAQYEILLEELAYPFEEQAIAVYEVNVSKIPQGVYDAWIKQSMASLGILMPARYGKIEQGGQYSDQLF